ncbi:MAG TPA: NAD-dependent epimerase/dehydratase family protein, partial [Pseudoxanthomonas sp.]|nr:NAD-dependent epimerase/dehydratase family protein [Pseudoxanthomonas sp.]
MRLLVCGGAGYVGSHAAQALYEAGHEVIVLDNLSTGHKEAVRWGGLIEADLLVPDSLEQAFLGEKIDAVLHFCATSLVG